MNGSGYINVDPGAMAVGAKRRGISCPVDLDRVVGAQLRRRGERDALEVSAELNCVAVTVIVSKTQTHTAHRRATGLYRLHTILTQVRAPAGDVTDATRDTHSRSVAPRARARAQAASSAHIVLSAITTLRPSTMVQPSDHRHLPSRSGASRGNGGQDKSSGRGFLHST